MFWKENTSPGLEVALGSPGEAVWGTSGDTPLVRTLRDGSGGRGGRGGLACPRDRGLASTRAGQVTVGRCFEDSSLHCKSNEQPAASAASGA